MKTPHTPTRHRLTLMRPYDAERPLYLPGGKVYEAVWEAGLGPPPYVPLSIVGDCDLFIDGFKVAAFRSPRNPLDRTWAALARDRFTDEEIGG